MSSFQAGGTKLERFLPENQHTQRKIQNFENWCRGEISKIGHQFSNKLILELMLSKNVNDLPTTSIFKIQEFPLGMLILRQKSFLFFIPGLKTQQSVLPYFWPQMGARTILCTRFKCRLSLQLSGKALVHKWQAYGFSPFNKIWTQY